MRLYLLLFFSVQLFSMQAQTNQQPVKASQQLLLAVKTGEPVDSLLVYFQTISFDELKAALNTDVKAKAFWLNIYNAYTQVLLQKNPSAYKNRNKFFKSREINIAEKQLSLDFIEHHIIRRSEWKLGLGYIKLLFPNSLEKQLRLGEKDYRIHFALNCGAKSCPPIAFYNDEKLEEQLNLAEKSFIKNDAEYDEAGNTVSVSKIFSWFRGDFVGKKGIRKLLVKHKMIPADKKVKLKFKKYDWSLMLKAF
jgi:Protein of unknown function, DUF547